MDGEFQAATTKTFPLGLLHGTHFSVVMSRKSGFNGFEKFTELPFLHLSVTADDEKQSWALWKQKSAGVGLTIDVTKARMPEIIKHFFGDSLAQEDTGYVSNSMMRTQHVDKPSISTLKSVTRIFLGRMGLSANVSSHF